MRSLLHVPEGWSKEDPRFSLSLGYIAIWRPDGTIVGASVDTHHEFDVFCSVDKHEKTGRSVWSHMDWPEGWYWTQIPFPPQVVGSVTFLAVEKR